MALFGAAARAEDAGNPLECRPEKVIEVAGETVWRHKGQEALFFRNGLAIAAAGAPSAYHPEDKGLDALANAGKPGAWLRVATVGGKPDGKPLVQGPKDPAPGFYVSVTALQDESRQRKDPRRYVNSDQVEYVALPPELLEAGSKSGVKLGDLAAILNVVNGKLAFGVVADQSENGVIGAGSIALARTLGIPAEPRTGGAKANVAYLVFPKSGNGKPRKATTVQKHGERLLGEFGGLPLFTACATKAR